MFWEDKESEQGWKQKNVPEKGTFWKEVYLVLDILKTGNPATRKQ